MVGDIRPDPLKADVCFGAPTHNEWRSFALDEPVGVKEYSAIFPDARDKWPYWMIVEVIDARAQKVLQDAKINVNERNFFSEINLNGRLIFEKRKRPGRDLNPVPVTLFL